MKTKLPLAALVLIAGCQKPLTNSSLNQSPQTLTTSLLFDTTPEEVTASDMIRKPGPSTPKHYHPITSAYTLRKHTHGNRQHTHISQYERGRKD